VRLTLTICLILSPLNVGHGQAGNDPLQVVDRMLRSGIFEGHDQKVVGRLGDEAAVLVTKLLEGRDLTSDTIENALVVIDESFVDPSLVQSSTDREPRTSLFVLRYLDLSTNDPELKKRIGDTRKYIVDRYNFSTQRK
jgi:hypothetical protein